MPRSSVAIFATLLLPALVSAQETLFSVASDSDDDEAGGLGNSPDQTKLLSTTEWAAALNRARTEAEVCDQLGCDFDGTFRLPRACGCTHVGPSDRLRSRRPRCSKTWTHVQRAHPC
jgi:hypothetical protein